MAKERIKGEEALSKHYQTICDMVDGDMSAEVLSSSIKVHPLEPAESPTHRIQGISDEFIPQRHTKIN
jgi:hypothetical protein